MFVKPKEDVISSLIDGSIFDTAVLDDLRCEPQNGDDDLGVVRVTQRPVEKT